MRDVEPNLRRASHGGLLREDAEEQQCLVVLLHAVPFDFTLINSQSCRSGWPALSLSNQGSEAVVTQT